MLKFIGSGSAFNTKLGNNSAYYKEGSQMLLIDCGSNVFQRIKENNLLDGIDHIHVAITHTHADHVGSLADLILYTYYSHGEFAKPKVTVYFSEGVEVNKLLDVNGCELNKTYYSKHIEEGSMLHIFNNVSVSFDKIKHVEEIPCYGMELKINGDYIFYSSDTNEIDDITLELIEEDVWNYFYIDTCKADYEGNVHLSLRKLNELIPEFYREKVWCMHLDEGFVREEAESMGFNVVRNEF